MPPTPSPPPASKLPLAIIIKDFLVEGGPNYSISLVGQDGKAVASTTGAKRGHPMTLVQMPPTSASDTRAYFLDGDSQVRSLSQDGNVAAVTTIPLGTNQAAVFAVSPDDRRIAVAVLQFPYPARTRIYVEDLVGGGNHVELFSSNTVLEWPVGWHQGHLVIAVGANAQPQNAYEGFEYGYSGYHVADASTGVRIATVCDGYTAYTPPVPAGTTCASYPSYFISDWTGARRSIPSDAGCGGGALSPDGSLVALCQGSAPSTLALLSNAGIQATTIRAVPEGWIDASHLVVQLSLDNSLAVLDTAILATTRIQAPGFFGGAIPGGL